MPKVIIAVDIDRCLLNSLAKNKFTGKLSGPPLNLKTDFKRILALWHQSLRESWETANLRSRLTTYIDQLPPEHKTSVEIVSMSLRQTADSDKANAFLNALGGLPIHTKDATPFAIMSLTSSPSILTAFQHYLAPLKAKLNTHLAGDYTTGTFQSVSKSFIFDSIGTLLLPGDTLIAIDDCGAVMRELSEYATAEEDVCRPSVRILGYQLYTPSRSPCCILETHLDTETTTSMTSSIDRILEKGKCDKQHAPDRRTGQTWHEIKTHYLKEHNISFDEQPEAHIARKAGAAGPAM